MSVHRISVLLGVLTFGLIVWGGHVNTTRSGMAFPDWPTSNTNPMLTYAPSQWLWQGDKFWEHGHRLFASMVGVVTVGLTVLAWRATPHADRPNGVIAGFVLLVLGTIASAIIGLQSMPTGFMEAFMIAMAISLGTFLIAAKRSNNTRRILWLCLAAFAGVCLQGAFGGYTVRNNLPAWTSVTHGMLAEVFFTIVLAIEWLSSKSSVALKQTSKTVKLVTLATWCFIAIQFLLGAITRHTESWGVSVTWPMWSETNWLPTTDLWQFPQVVIHFIHRTTAYAVAVMILVQAYVLRGTSTSTWGYLQVALVVVQIALGVGVITEARNEAITTLHVMVGVVLLAVASRMTFTYNLSRTSNAKGMINAQPIGMHV